MCEMESDHLPEAGDLYCHRQTTASVIYLSSSEVDGVTTVRLGRPGHDSPIWMVQSVFLEKYEWLGQNVLTEKERHAFGIEGE